MCSKVMHIKMAYIFPLIPDRFKIQKMCIKAVEKDPCSLVYGPNHFKTKNICDASVSEDSFSLQWP